MVVRVPDDTRSEITLRSVNMKGVNEPILQLGNRSDVTLRLEGSNFLNKDGIRVPATSRLTVTGEGNLSVTNNRNYSPTAMTPTARSSSISAAPFPFIPPAIRSSASAAGAAPGTGSRSSAAPAASQAPASRPWVPAASPARRGSICGTPTFPSPWRATTPSASAPSPATPSSVPPAGSTCS